MTSRLKLTARAGIAGLLFPLMLSASARAQDDQDWEWVVAPYVWFLGISGDSSLPDRPAGDDRDIDAGDVLDALEFAALVRVGGSSPRWRVLGDAAFLGLGKRSKRDVASLDFDTLMLELAGAYRPNERLDLLFGARYWDVDFAVDFDNDLLTDVKTSSDWIDPIVGVRFNAPLGQHWTTVLRADIGGFDVGSDFTWNAELLFAWDATDHFSLVLGYRHLDIDETLETRVEDVDLDVALSGPRSASPSGSEPHAGRSRGRAQAALTRSIRAGTS